MKTLLLHRNAKSSWKHPELADHDRPLNKRGKRTAPLMGALLLDEGLKFFRARLTKWLRNYGLMQNH